MPTEKEIIENLRKCPRFNWCSINICPLDIEVSLKAKLPEENSCPFCLKKRARLQKGIRTQMPPHLLEFIAKSNVKMLSRGNQKRWHTLHKL